MKLARAHVLVGVDEEARLAGVDRVIAAFREELEALGIADEVQVVEVGHLGISGWGVVVVVYPEGVYYGHVTPEAARIICREHLLKGHPVEELRLPAAAPVARPQDVLSAQRRVVLRNCGVINPADIEEYIATGGYEALTKALTEMSPEAVLEEIKESGLRGRGGAGFPTGLKWEAVRRAPGEEKYVLCNADEGEPGTFKDRLIMEGDPHRLIEGMAIAAYAVGARRGYVYIRGEYALSIARFNQALEAARKLGLLGEGILGTGFSFDIEVKVGAGSYVCGEETALIESLEGKRGWPRIRPPYPVTHGLFGKPTVVNNVETLANVPDIVLRGAGWFRSMGVPSCPGTKVYSLLGAVRYRGLVEVEMGTPLRTLIYELGGGLPEGKRLKAVLVGGAAGAFLPPEMLDVRMDFDSMREAGAVLGSGAIVVLDDGACVLDVLSAVLRFFRHESCGQCTPCRVGTDLLVKLHEAVCAGKADPSVLDRMLEVAEAMQVASLCPLGQSVVLPVGTALRWFRGEFEKHITEGPCPRCRAQLEAIH
ncbi:NADH-quinone oxidoreductase subunit NuoF [Candidatus Bipolaricaulota sp. J31]